MAAVRTYGIPHAIEVHEIFTYNGGIGKLHVRFRGGVVDPKYNIPATYSTSSEFEQLVIEGSSQFGVKVFRYGPKGEQIATSTCAVKRDEDIKVKQPPHIKSTIEVDSTKEYPNVETLGEATEVLMELGVDASELGGKNAILAAMVQQKVSFPNLKVK